MVSENSATAYQQSQPDARYQNTGYAAQDYAATQQPYAAAPVAAADYGQQAPAVDYVQQPIQTVQPQQQTQQPQQHYDNRAYGAAGYGE